MKVADERNAGNAKLLELEGEIAEVRSKNEGLLDELKRKFSAAEAMRAVLKELSGSALMGGGMIPNGSDRWAALKNLLERGGYLDTAADAELRCIFGVKEGPASFVSASELECVAPNATLAGATAVTVHGEGFLAFSAEPAKARRMCRSVRCRMRTGSAIV